MMNEKCHLCSPESELTTEGAAGGLDEASHEITCCCLSEVMASIGNEDVVNAPAAAATAAAATAEPRGCSWN